MHKTYTPFFQPSFCLEYPYPYSPLNIQAKPLSETNLPMFLPPLDFNIPLLLYSPNNTNLWCDYGLWWNLGEPNTKLSHSSVPDSGHYLRGSSAEGLTELRQKWQPGSELIWDWILFQAYQEPYLLAGFSPTVLLLTFARSHQQLEAACHSLLHAFSRAVHKV